MADGVCKLALSFWWSRMLGMADLSTDISMTLSLLSRIDLYTIGRCLFCPPEVEL